MREMRQVRRPDYFGACDYVQGVRMVYHGLFGQDETTDRRHVETDTDGNDNGAL